MRVGSFWNQAIHYRSASANNIGNDAGDGRNSRNNLQWSTRHHFTGTTWLSCHVGNGGTSTTRRNEQRPRKGDQNSWLYTGSHATIYSAPRSVVRS